MASKTLEIVIVTKDESSEDINSIADAIGNFGKKAGTIAIGAIGAIGGLGLGFGKLAIDAAPLEQIQAAFTGIAEASGESAPKVLAALQQSSGGMIAQQDLLLSYNKAAQLVSDSFANQLPSAMESLSKVSASTGQDMNFLLDSLVTGVGRASPMILDNLGIQVDLADASANAAEQFGVEADELSKTQIQAALMNQVLEKLAQNTADMPATTGTAVEALGQFDATMQNLKDQIGLQLLPVMLPFLQTFAQLAQEFLPLAVEKFTEFGAKMQETIGPAILLINDALTRMGEAMGITSDDVTIMDAVLAGLEGVLNAVITGVQLMAVAFQTAAAAVEWVSDAIGTLNDFIQTGIAGWQKAADAIGALGSLNLGAFLPGSPTPFEMGLRGITDAMREMQGVADMTLPNLAAGGNMTMAGAGGSQSINIYLDGQQIAGALIRGGNPDARRKSGGMTNL